MKKTKKLLLSTVLAVSLGVAIQGCGGSNGTTKESSNLIKTSTDNKTLDVSTTQTYKKKKETNLASEPSSFRKYALVASGKINVRHTLSTDGPLADVHANGPIVAKTRSLNISGKITSENKLTDAITRSYNYKSNTADTNMVTIRALKVSEFINLNSITEYIELSKDGKITKVTEDKTEELSAVDRANVTFKNGVWTITGGDIKIEDTLKVDGSLKIDADYTFVSGALLVSGDLDASGELNINVGTPFDSALVVNKSMMVEKLTTIGRVHSSGDFTAKGKVNIVGNAEIDGNVDLYDDAKINMLDNVYKAALADAQEESEKSGVTQTLVHSQLFSDVKGNNSIVLFTFVEGDYLMSEKTLNDLVKSGDIKDFKFKSSLYGASIEYVSQLSKTDYLSDFYKNLITVKKELSKKYGDVKVKRYIDIAPSNLFCQFVDANDQDLGTYLIDNIAHSDVSKLIKLTDEQKQKAIENLDNPNKADEDITSVKIEDSNTSDANITKNTPAELKEVDDNITLAIATTDKDAIENENKKTRINEWVEYQELATENRVVEVQEVGIDNSTTKQRGWWRRLKHRVRKFFRKITLTDCHKKIRHHEIRGVNNSQLMNDDWGKDVSLWNSPYNYCTPTAAAMIMQYHVKIRTNKGSLYSNDGASYYSGKNSYVKKWVGHLWTRKDGGTDAIKTVVHLPRSIYRESKDNGLSWGWASSYLTSVFTRTWQFYWLEWYLNRNRPCIYHAHHSLVKTKKIKDFHSMPVIGWKTASYSGWCAKKIWPNKNWVLVDSEFGKKEYIRFDSRSNYWKYGAVSYIWVH